MCALLIGREIQLCTPGNPLKWMKEFPQKEQKLEESIFASIAIEQNSFAFLVLKGEWNFEYEPKIKWVEQILDFYLQASLILAV